MGVNRLSLLGYCQNEDSSTYRVGKAGLIFELAAGENVLAASGKETICCAITGYTSGAVEKYSDQLSYSFRYDATCCDGWMYEDKTAVDGWCPAAIGEKSKTYFARPIQPLIIGAPVDTRVVAQGRFSAPADESASGQRIYGAYMQHVPLSELSAGSPAMPSPDGIFFHGVTSGDGLYVVIDMGKERAGYFQIDIETAISCSIDVGFGEHLEDLRVRSAVGGRNFAFTYITKVGRSRFTHYMKRIAGRYLQLHIKSYDFRLFYAGILPAEYPLKEVDCPAGLDRLEQKIYAVSVDTLKLCMHEHYEDCPWREQALYAMDSRNQMLCGYYAFGEYDFPKANIRLLGYGLREDGLLELCAPARVPVTIPSFSLIWIVSLWEYCQHSGDVAFASEMMPTVTRILQTFAMHMYDGLVQNSDDYWNFYEWSEHMDGTVKRNGADAPLNAFYTMALNAARNLYVSMKQEQEAQRILSQMVALRSAYTAAFWSDERQAFRLSSAEGYTETYTELTQALTICANLYMVSAQKSNLLQQISEGKFAIKCTLSHCIFKYGALLQEPSYAQQVFDEIAAVWGRMLFTGATSFWETEKGAADFDCAGSLCHGWSAIPVYIYHRFGNLYTNGEIK